MNDDPEMCSSVLILVGWGQGAARPQEPGCALWILRRAASGPGQRCEPGGNLAFTLTVGVLIPSFSELLAAHLWNEVLGRMNPSDMRGTVPPTVQWIQKRGEQSAALRALSQSPFSSAPAGMTWLSLPSLHSWCGDGFLLFLLVGTNTGWDEWPLPFLGSASLRLLSTLSQPSARCPHCRRLLCRSEYLSDAISASSPQRCSLLAGSFVCAVKHNDKLSSSDISLPLPRSLPSFIKDWVVFYPLIRFQNTVYLSKWWQPPDKAGGDRKLGMASRGLLNLLWQQGRGC